MTGTTATAGTTATGKSTTGKRAGPVMTARPHLGLHRLRSRRLLAGRQPHHRLLAGRRLQLRLLLLVDRPLQLRPQA